MYVPKTKETDRSVIEFIEAIDHPQKRVDAYKLLEIFTETTGFQAKMWGPSIIGFGTYHYRYESGHEGDSPLAGFSPRKAKISLYFDIRPSERERLLKALGKHTAGKVCVYVNKLADIDLEALKVLILHSMEVTKEKYPD